MQCLAEKQEQSYNDIRNIILTDKCGKIVYCNDAWSKTCGYSINDVLGKTNGVLQGPLTERDEIDFINKSLKCRMIFSTTLTNYKKDGSPFKNLLYIETLSDGFLAEVQDLGHCDYTLQYLKYTEL